MFMPGCWCAGDADACECVRARCCCVCDIFTYRVLQQRVAEICVTIKPMVMCHNNNTIADDNYKDRNACRLMMG